MSIKSSFSVTRTPFYYGWVILFVTTLGILSSIPGQTMGISVLTDALIFQYGLDRSEISAIYMIGTIASSFLLPYAGRLLDRFGSRKMIFFATFGLFLSILLLAHGPQIGNWFRQQFQCPNDWPTIVMLGLAFLGLRHFGQGQITMVSRTTLSRWFESKRGVVTALSGLLVSLGFGVAPYFLNLLLHKYSWHTMLYILAFLVLNMTIVGVIFFRDQPESCGWTMEKGFAKDAQSQDPQLESHTSLSTALKTMVFWLFNLGTTLHALIITAVVFHMSAIGREHGLDNAQAFALFLPMSISSTLSNLLAGYLSDRVSIRYHLIVMQFSLAIGVVSCQSLDHWYGYGLTILGLGISGGVYVCLLGVAWPKFFGRRYLGEINGFNMGCVVFGSAFGPYLFSLIFDLFQTFSWALYLSALPTIGIGLMTLLLPKAFAIETK